MQPLSTCIPRRIVLSASVAVWVKTTFLLLQWNSSRRPARVSVTNADALAASLCWPPPHVYSIFPIKLIHERIDFFGLGKCGRCIVKICSIVNHFLASQIIVGLADLYFRVESISSLSIFQPSKKSSCFF